MKAWICWFRLCKWRHVTNLLSDVAPCGDAHAHEKIAIYQCVRCKSLSIGCPRPFANE